MAENQNQVQNNQPSKFKKVIGGAKKVLIAGGLVMGGAIIEHKTHFMGKAIEKLSKKNNEESAQQRTFQVRHDFQKGGQR